MVLVRLKDIIEGMEFQSDEMTAYLHRPTGRMLTVSDEAFTAAEGDDDDWVEPEELSEPRTFSPPETSMSRFPIVLRLTSVA
jgi:hypothetical protein